MNCIKKIMKVYNVKIGKFLDLFFVDIFVISIKQVIY